MRRKTDAGSCAEASRGQPVARGRISRYQPQHAAQEAATARTHLKHLF
ncbi:IMP cyclohydrolase / Phosphoribosylaminoimidazolecarboxamide formyltransferase [Caballeronia sordidicola]|uniref:IMP cyclohydrolase / Phosphoribosylaminoimidazolecarboxamide formyltransferase n=1 Tax=Caballeronia sordidicola TaxID=196367 RepID=A0A226XCU9_CABSO|nr:IMP cyclohydrolase / Phosphoribosylaminoimidazolecarboxamide formyltransferase [Caballeronia sordidicola]